MSYQLHLLGSTEAGAHLLSAARARFDPEAVGAPDPLKEARKRRIADRLRAITPQFEPFKLDYQRIAVSQGISEEEARRRFRHIELDGPKNGSGVHITLFDDTAVLTVPYWHEGLGANKVFKEVWQYLLIFEKEGFQPYDPQLGRLLNLDVEFENVLRNYVSVTGRFLPSTAAPRKPWWKIWARDRRK
jgi:hypothetical protein